MSNQEKVARALAGMDLIEEWPTNAALGGSLTGTRDDEFRDGMLEQAAAAIDALADVDGIAGVLGQVLRDHQQTSGMSVASGVTCRCGYWSGKEVPGKTRPAGYCGLQWHQVTAQAAAVVAWMKDAL